MKHVTPIVILLLFYLVNFSKAQTHHIGVGFTHADFESAAAVCLPGDTIVFHEGIHLGNQFVSELKGTLDNWIYIMNAPNELPIIQGGNNTIQLSDPAYLKIIGLTFQQATGNGFNLDDAGTYDSPAQHIIFENCTFRDMASNGNNDLLKLSGVDHFEINNCSFLNGADGGSGIDMVGCHQGLIRNSYFENMGSNSIQAKGGTEWVRIEANFFKDGGNRTLNLGGSTGLEYFRPLDAPFEAANLQVYSNIIVGSWAAIAFVGSINVEVINNTIYQPENWVIRILQETVDPDRFFECGNNVFKNNIIYLNNNLSTETNIGPNTLPETFNFSNNLWFNSDDNNWDGPNMPVTDSNIILNENPIFIDAPNDDFSISISSPASGVGENVVEPLQDFFENNFNNPRSVGAIEANPSTSISTLKEIDATVDIFPNPSPQELKISFDLKKSAYVKIYMIDIMGRKQSLFSNKKLESGFYQKEFNLEIHDGVYLIKMEIGEDHFSKQWVKMK